MGDAKQVLGSDGVEGVGGGIAYYVGVSGMGERRLGGWSFPSECRDEQLIAVLVVFYCAA